MIELKTTTIRTRKCPMCGEDSLVTVPTDGYRKWAAGAFVQEAFPQMPAGGRELLITGTHSKCWDDLWSEDESDEWEWE